MNALVTRLGNPGLIELVVNHHRDTAYAGPRLLGLVTEINPGNVDLAS